MSEEPTPQAPPAPTVLVAAKIDPALHRRFRVALIQSGMTAQGFFERCILDLIAEEDRWRAAMDLIAEEDRRAAENAEHREA